jgi:hypothetical protein
MADKSRTDNDNFLESEYIMFTEEEKHIAKCFGKTFNWIARDENNNLCFYRTKPLKRWIGKGIWVEPLGSYYKTKHCYNDIKYVAYGLGGYFQSIRWEDAEPTLIKDIYDPQILNDKEREYLTAVLKPLPTAKTIRKAISPLGVYQYLVVDFNESEFMSFPYFEPDTMYKGMECCKLYTPEELGIKL